MNVINLEDTKNKKCIKCDDALIVGDNWAEGNVRQHKYICIDCYSNHINGSRMFVNGKYISTKHPLYKVGRYKSFNEAAFSSLEKDKKIKDGYVYAIINPAWPDWVKIGMAIDAEDRLNGYQTSSPMRDYKLIHSVYFKNRSKAERNAHKLAEKIAERKGEWFNISNKQSIKVLEEVSDG